MYNKTNKKFDQENINFAISLIKDGNNKRQCYDLFFKKFNKTIGKHKIVSIAKDHGLTIKNGRVITFDELTKRLAKFKLKLDGKYSGSESSISMICFCGKRFTRKANSVFMGYIKSCGCLRRLDALNELLKAIGKFGATLLSDRPALLKNIEYKTVVRLKCYQDHEFNAVVGRVISGVKKCFECYCRRVYYMEIGGVFWKTIKANAKRRGLEFKITREQVWDLFLKQNRKCVLSGVDLRFAKIGENRKETTASLDRINSKKGYIRGNIQWIYKPLNALKMDFDQSNFIKLCIMIADYNK